MKRISIIFTVIVVLCSCSGFKTSGSTVTMPDSGKLDQYLRTADHLNESEQISLKNGRPFIGMTFDEVLLSMIHVHTSGKLDEKILKGGFMNHNARHYILFFDGGQPNRVIAWSAFTDKEFKELKSFRKTRPIPPLVLPLR